MKGNSQLCIRRWSTTHVAKWLEEEGFCEYVDTLCNKHRLDGITLLTLTEYDLRSPPLEIKILGDIQRLMLSIRKLRKHHTEVLEELGYGSEGPIGSLAPVIGSLQGTDWLCNGEVQRDCDDCEPVADLNSDQYQYANGKNKHSERRLDPEYWKTALSCIYALSILLFTAFVMVIVHERVPDVQTYPPLPDIFLDNFPRIPWAFTVAEVFGMILWFLWLLVLFLHKHRSIILRRFFCLIGAMFFLRSVTMFVTSLSVPDQHLQCSEKMYDNVWAKLKRAFGIWIGFGMMFNGLYDNVWAKVKRAFGIWIGFGLIFSGTRMCGDYMFSGHTVVLTMLNFFISEYTPRSWKFLHTLTWLLNLFGMVLVVASHEHYTIDVFIAYYITTRLFWHYHTLANPRSYQQIRRARNWFPMFSFFECNVNGTVPNEYCWPFAKPTIMKKLIG